jgi:hypothetical protein
MNVIQVFCYQLSFYFIRFNLFTRLCAVKTCEMYDIVELEFKLKYKTKFHSRVSKSVSMRELIDIVNFHNRINCYIFVAYLFKREKIFAIVIV